MSQDNPDIRQQVEGNQGALKKLQLLIPGLRGYRTKEDIRVSDEMLRNQVADRLDRAKSNLEQLRKAVASAGDYTNLTGIGSLIAQVQALSGEVRHAAQGYSGWVAPIQMGDDKLNKLYDYDYSLVNTIFQFEASTQTGSLKYDPTAPNAIQATLSQMSSEVADIKNKWSVRIDTIQGVALN